MAYNARELVLKETVDKFIQLEVIDAEQWNDLKKRIRLVSVKRLYSIDRIQEIQDLVERKFKGFILGDIAKYVQDMHRGLTRKPIDHISRIEKLVELFNSLGFIAETGPLGLIVAVIIGGIVVVLISKFVFGSTGSLIKIVLVYIVFLLLLGLVLYLTNPVSSNIP